VNIRRILVRAIIMKKELYYLLFLLASLMLGSGCGSGTGSPEDSGSPGKLGNKTASEPLNRPEGVSGFQKDTRLGHAGCFMKEDET
jgi:hypothetical protein